MLTKKIIVEYFKYINKHAPVAILIAGALIIGIIGAIMGYHPIISFVIGFVFSIVALVINGLIKSERG